MSLGFARPGWVEKRSFIAWVTVATTGMKGPIAACAPLTAGRVVALAAIRVGLVVVRIPSSPYYLYYLYLYYLHL